MWNIALVHPISIFIEKKNQIKLDLRNGNDERKSTKRKKKLNHHSENYIFLMSVDNKVGKAWFSIDLICGIQNMLVLDFKMKNKIEETFIHHQIDRKLKHSYFTMITVCWWGNKHL